MAFRGDAWLSAGEGLVLASQFPFALQTLERGLAIQPNHLDAQRLKGHCLEALADPAAGAEGLGPAKAHVLALLEIAPQEAGCWALLGGIETHA